MTPATAYLTFSAHRAARLATDEALWLARREEGTAEPMVLLRQLDRAILAARASGIHADRAAAVAYAAREASPGRPFILITPDGELELVPARARDAQLDVTIAREERDYAERLRRMTHREEHGPARPARITNRK